MSKSVCMKETEAEVRPGLSGILPYPNEVFLSICIRISHSVLSLNFEFQSLNFACYCKGLFRTKLNST